MNYRFYIFSFLFFFLGAADGFAQGDTIKLNNPSFEGYPRSGTVHGRVHTGWYDCGKTGESVPDVQPNLDPNKPFFGVTTKAYDGGTYLGMVARDNDTWEALGQRLRFPLEAGKCYTFSIYLAKSAHYISPARGNSGNDTKTTDHVRPLKLRVFGSNNYCMKSELLDESSMIDHLDWKEYTFRFEPKSNVSFIILEAFYKTPTPFPYNGNLLVDNASNIRVISCEDDPKPIVKITSPVREKQETKEDTYRLYAKVKNVASKKQIKVLLNRKTIPFDFNSRKKSVSARLALLPGNNKIEVRASNKGGDGKDDAIIVYEEEVVAVATPPVTSPPATPDPVVKKPKKEKINIPILQDLSKIKQGQVIRINKLYFDIDSYSIKRDVEPVLQEVYLFLKQNPSVRVEIGGHTNNRCDTEFCNELSENRARSVVKYLKEMGISASQMVYKGYGKAKPVATNSTPTGRKRNQRVELKVLSMNG